MGFFAVTTNGYQLERQEIGMACIRSDRARRWRPNEKAKLASHPTELRPPQVSPLHTQPPAPAKTVREVHLENI